jgi:hypothetical protein
MIYGTEPWKLDRRFGHEREKVDIIASCPFGQRSEDAGFNTCGPVINQICWCCDNVRDVELEVVPMIGSLMIDMVRPQGFQVVRQGSNHHLNLPSSVDHTLSSSSTLSTPHYIFCYTSLQTAVNPQQWLGTSIGPANARFAVFEHQIVTS